MKTIQTLMGLKGIDHYMFRKIVFIILLSTIVLLSGGCASKPEMLVRTEYQDVAMPVKCEVTLPQNVEFKETDPQTWIDIGRYHIEVELLLKACVGETR
ncbi:hypothetical protein CCAL12920_00655 [Campylobacter sp. RM12920]|uniref:Lipoprotein n=1 Tax=Campylobacter californiensis TaxID=1032243 RepID=A0ABD4JFI9_9BACT|nr:hypothetical protein [Campylobacter sp. RM9328]MBE2985561.1 hypothetical protein [Campylobacter sp. RM12919]MBE2987410.1 hypothetical protein [Campylobacter sp. RM12920]